jgi:hypothetical protein
LRRFLRRSDRQLEDRNGLFSSAYLSSDGDLWCILETNRRLCSVLIVE